MNSVQASFAMCPPGVTNEDPVTGCCWGEVGRGPMFCTCWEPVYDLQQRPLENGGVPPDEDEIPTRTKCCADCAYRTGSPERERGEGEELREYAENLRKEFWCHQGVRRVVLWRHPDGREVQAGEGDYRPPVGPDDRPVVWKADGTVGERCAGWGAHR